MASAEDSSDWYLSSMLEMAKALHELQSDDFDEADIEAGANRLLDELAERHDSALKQEFASRDGFESRLYETWQDAFDLYDFTVLLNERTGMLFAAMQGAKFGIEADACFTALVRIHARSCQVAREIGTLIRSGYADGAFSRWRSLYELAAVARVIADHGDETAERFLLHRHIDDFHEMISYQKCYEELGFQPIEDDVVESVEDLQESLLNEYGASFNGKYGWASHVMDGRVNMKDIINEAGLEEFWAHYKFASDSVHGGSKGTQHRLGLTEDTQDRLLASGPTNIGFTDPAQFSVIMLTHVTEALLQSADEPYWDVASRTLDEFPGEVATTFAFAPMERDLKEVSWDIASRLAGEIGEPLFEDENAELDNELDDDVVDEILEDVFDPDSD